MILRTALLLFLTLLICPSDAQAQDTTFVREFGGGPEFQLYPTGFIAGITFYQSLNQHGYVHVRFGYNHVRHGDNGLHEDESGHGWGGSLGYDQLVNLSNLSFLAGVRADIWKNKVNWINNIGEVNEMTGTTKITVLQPTARIGYPIDLGPGYLLPALSFGAEINVDTNGEEVGDGLILLLGLSYIWN